MTGQDRILSPSISPWTPHLDSGRGQEVEGCICWGEDGDRVRAPESLRQTGRPDRRHQRGEGRVDGQGVEHCAGQAARACGEEKNIVEEKIMIRI